MRTRKPAPQVESVVDEDHTRVTVKVALPGVEAKNLRLRVRDDRLQVKAVAGGVEYHADHHFCCHVDPREATSSLEDGVLRVEAPFSSPFFRARDVRVGSRVERSRQALDFSGPLSADIDRLRV